MDEILHLHHRTPEERRASASSTSGSNEPVLVLRHKPDYRPSAQQNVDQASATVMPAPRANSAPEPLPTLTLTHNPSFVPAQPAPYAGTALHSAHSGMCLWETAALSGRALGNVTYTQISCNDGVVFNLDCNEHTLLTGENLARSVIQGQIIDHALRSSMPVIVFTPTEVDPASYLNYCPSMPHTHCRSISNHFFSPGFCPFSGWNDNQTLRYLEDLMRSEDFHGNAHSRTTLQYLLKMFRANPAFARQFCAGEVYEARTVIEQLNNTQLPEQELDQIAAHFRSTAPNDFNRVVDALQNFLRMFEPDLDGTAQPWCLLSPGVTFITIDPNAFDGQRPGGWYLKRMLPTLVSMIAARRQKLLVVTDNISPDTMNDYSSLIRNSFTKVIAISDSMSDVPNGMLAMLSRRLVFTQADANAADYWARQTGDQQILQRDWGTQRARTRQPFQLFSSTTTTDTEHYTPIYRPCYQARDFTNLRQDSGFLFSAVNGELCHEFTIPI